MKVHAAWVGLLCAFCLPHQSAAELRVCNPTSVSQSVSIASKTDTGWISEGWWNLAPDACAVLVKGDLKQRYYYYRATSSGSVFEGTGHIFCTTSAAFTIEVAENCEAQGYDSSVFAEIDTGRAATTYELQLLEPNPGGKSEDRATVPARDTSTDVSSRSGSVGEPYSVSAVFQDCEAHDGAQACSFHAEGAKWFVWYGAETPAPVINQMESLSTGDLVDVTGDLIHMNDISVDTAVWSIQTHGPRNEWENTLAGLQGVWKNRDKPKEVLEVSGGEARVFYDGQQTEHSYIQVGHSCEDLSDMGLVLVRRDPPTREDYCYAILGLDAVSLHLSYMQGTGGNEFFYWRQ